MATFYNKYRPRLFADVFDQQNIVQTLKNAVELKKVGHAYLFTGPKGTGKTTLARIFAKAVNCQNPKQGEPCLKCKSCQLIESNQNLDISEIDAASHTGVENIRELKENIHTAPAALKYKVYVIDEAHMLSPGAFNALLKSLEEPPSFVIFILATTEAHKIPATIASRCQRLYFKRIDHQLIQDKLKKIAQSEGISITPGALNQIAAAAEGGLRDAESLLDQITNLAGKKIKTRQVLDILDAPDQQIYHRLARAIIEEQLQTSFELVGEAVYAGRDLSYFTRGLIEYLRQLMVLKINPDHLKTLTDELDDKSLKQLVDLAEKTTLNQLGRIIGELIQARNLIKDSPLPQIPLELALVKLIDKEQPLAPTKPTEPAKPIEVKVKPEQKINPPKTPQAQPKPAPKSEPKFRKQTKIKPQSKSKTKLTLSQIHKAWPQLVKDIKKFNHSLWAIIQNCQPVGIDQQGQIIVKTQYNFHKSRLEDMTNRKIINQAASQILDSDCSFCYLLESEIPPELKQNNTNAAAKVLDELGGEIIE